LTVRTLLVLGFTGLSLSMSYDQATKGGYLAPKPPLHGIWNVQEIVVDGQVQAPLAPASKGWRRVIIDAPGAVTIQYWNDARQDYLMVLNEEQHTILLAKLNDPSRDLEQRMQSVFANMDNPSWTGMLTYTEPAPGVLVLQGTVDGQPVRITLVRFDESQLPLNHSFRWFAQ
jgi:hypothetical protein